MPASFGGGDTRDRHLWLGAPVHAQRKFHARVRRHRPRSKSVDIGLSPTLRIQARDSDVAVIGMSGRFPHADNVGAFWRNLAEGKNCIGEVPPERWDHSLIYEPGSRKPNKTNSKWGGFLADADKFDPLVL